SLHAAATVPGNRAGGASDPPRHTLLSTCVRIAPTRSRSTLPQDPAQCGSRGLHHACAVLGSRTGLGPTAAPPPTLPLSPPRVRHARRTLRCSPEIFDAHHRHEVVRSSRTTYDDSAGQDDTDASQR